MSDPNAFAKLVPGFDFMQALVKNAGSALPGIGQWVAPTLNPEEIEKRINELRTVQFWLEQNARMLGATIQALEVQRMTLSTLKTMNVQMGDLRDSLKLRVPDAAAQAAPHGAPPGGLWPNWPVPEAAQAGAMSAVAGSPPAADAAPTGATPPAAGQVDPMQWWNALTQQFTQLAAGAMKQEAGASADGSGGAAAAPVAGEAPVAKGNAGQPFAADGDAEAAGGLQAGAAARNKPAGR